MHVDKKGVSIYICLFYWTLKVKQEIAQLCDTLTNVTSPKLDEQNEAIIMLMSESTAAKERLTKELREAHETLVAQIYSLRQKSMDVLDNIERASRPNMDEHISDVDALIARIDSLSASSAKIIEERVSLICLNFSIMYCEGPQVAFAQIVGFAHARIGACE